MSSRITSISLITFFSLFVFITASFAAGAADALMVEAGELAKSGDRAGAIEKYREAIAKEPKSFAAEIKLARLLKKEKKYAPAILHFRRAVELSTGRTKYGTKKELAEVLSWTKDKSQAIDIYKEILRERPDDSGARIGLARVYSWTGRYKEAIEEYRRVLQLKPGSLEARMGLARVNSWQGGYDESIAGYRDILKERPGNTEARVGLISVLRWKGDITESLSEARRFLAEEPEHPEAIRLEKELRKSKGPYIQLTRSDGEDSDDNRLIRYKLSGYFSAWDNQVVHLSYSTYHATAPFNREADARLFTIKSGFKIKKDFILTPRLSIATLEASGRDVTRLLPALGLRWRYSKRLTLSTSYSQNMLMDTAQLIKKAIKLDEASLSGSYNKGIYTLSTGYRYSKYPDRNFSNRLYANLSRGFIKEDPRLSGGVRFDYVNFNKDLSNGYYDPQNYYAFTLHATLENDVYDDQLYYRFVAGFGSQIKSGTSWELKASLKGKLLWRINSNLSTWVAYKWSRSALESATGYNYNALELGIGYLF